MPRETPSLCINRRIRITAQHKSSILTRAYPIERKNLYIRIQGFVQSVGFRPFVYRLAKRYQQLGWVSNSNAGVDIIIEGSAEQQQGFLVDIQTQLPPFAKIKSFEVFEQALTHFRTFRIKESSQTGNNSIFVLPDIAPCPACLDEIDNPASRFYRYPFTSCCYCGPRYSIIQSQPYDRLRTAMVNYELCPDCQTDYRSPDNRRFHAQTIACPRCGPQLRLLSDQGHPLADGDAALNLAVEQLRAGKIIALKGVGGFQLLVDAGSADAVRRLRNKKQRPKKPFALLTQTLDTAHLLCIISNPERHALCSPSAPIVLLPRRRDISVAVNVAPDNMLLGVMLPASPLHHLLSRDFGAPLVATSGNRQNETICIDNSQALEKLGEIADYFLMHDRPILRPLDDSIVRLIGGKMTVLRRARGYTPLPVTISRPLPATLATGSYLKNTVAVAQGQHIIASQHHGDLDAAETQQQFANSIDDLLRFYAFEASIICHDLHPDYSSSRYARHLPQPKLALQHHYAHILSCMAEHDLAAPQLGIAWDGTGLGNDKTIWGGEVLMIFPKGFDRYAHLRTFPLPGGDQAAREPKRSALGLLYALFGDELFERKDLLPLQEFTDLELGLLKQALTKRINCPATSSMGRTFDALSSLLGLCHVNQYEGQAAMLLEQSATGSNDENTYPYHLSGFEPIEIDWEPMILQVIQELPSQPPEIIATRFHNTLADIILAIARKSGQTSVVLSGGCFQNACLTNKTLQKLKNTGIRVYTHERIPPNDGGLSVGQAYATAWLHPT